MELDQVMSDSVALPDFLNFCYTGRHLIVPSNLLTWKASWSVEIFKN